MVISFLIIVSGLIGFMSNRSHLLSMLLSLEFVVLGIFWSLFSWLLLCSGEMFLLLLFLTLTACEASIGLSLLVSLIRTHGNDFYSNLNMC